MSDFQFKFNVDLMLTYFLRLSLIFFFKKSIKRLKIADKLKNRNDVTIANIH